MTIGLSDYAAKNMRLIIDGYNLLHSGRTLTNLNSTELQREREYLIQKLSDYRQVRTCEIILVFDGWQGGWVTERRERKSGIEVIFSKVGEKADEVIKRMVREKGAGSTIITSDREITNYAGRFNGTSISSEQFWDKLEGPSSQLQKDLGDEGDDVKGMKKKGPSRRLSKKEKRKLSVLRKL